jgi:hypothetical protein
MRISAKNPTPPESYAAGQVLRRRTGNFDPTSGTVHDCQAEAMQLYDRSNQVQA